MDNSKVLHEVVSYLFIHGESIHVSVNWIENETEARHTAYLSTDQEKLVKYYFNEHQFPRDTLTVQCIVTRLPQVAFHTDWTGSMSWLDWRKENGKTVRLDGSFRCFFNYIRTNERDIVIVVYVECDQATAFL